MTIYQSITGNSWKESDGEAYQKISRIPLDTIEQSMRITSTRAAARPNSLAYFVKEIIAAANPSSQSKSARKKALAAIVARVRELRAGMKNDSIADFSAE